MAEIAMVAESGIEQRTRIEMYREVLRINHWFKNIFVFIGSIAALFYFNIPITFSLLQGAILIFILSCFLSAVNYIINGIVDKPFDAKHPRKKHRAIPMGLLSTKEIALFGCGLLLMTLGISLYFLNIPSTIMLLVFLVAGIIYNIRPLRTKDLPYIDVISEAVNNPIRLLLGWFAVVPDQTMPPLELLFLFWTFGCFLMTAKRYAEFRFLREDSVSFRITFKYYSERSLYWAMMFYNLLTMILLFMFSIKYKFDLVFGFPGILIFIIWFLKITDEEDSIVKDPEKIFQKRAFFCYSLTLTGLLLYLSI